MKVKADGITVHHKSRSDRLTSRAVADLMADIRDVQKVAQSSTTLGFTAPYSWVQAMTRASQLLKSCIRCGQANFMFFPKA
jgi:hypothetical protein